VNLDPACEPLADFLVGLDRQFERWPLERRYKQAHVAKPMRANWKVVQEGGLARRRHAPAALAGDR
jgi:hypothetical protein